MITNFTSLFGRTPRASSAPYKNGLTYSEVPSDLGIQSLSIEINFLSAANANSSSNYGKAIRSDDLFRRLKFCSGRNKTASPLALYAFIPSKTLCP